MNVDDDGWTKAVLKTREVADALRQRLRVDAFGHIVIEDFLPLTLASDVSELLSKNAKFKRVYALFSQDGGNRGEIVNRSTWMAAPAQRRLFRFEHLDELLSGAPNAWLIPSFTTSLSKGSLHEFFSTIYEQKFGGVVIEAHRMQVGDFIGPHSDVRANRALAVICYLTKNWEERFGGELVLVGDGTSHCSIWPRFNRLVAFDVRRCGSHYVNKVLEQCASEGRQTLSAWMLQG